MKTTRILATLAGCVALLVLASSASAYSLQSFDAADSSTVAGAHPDFSTTLVFPYESLGGELFESNGKVRDAVVKLPPGMIGNPTAVPQCLQVEFEELACRADSQVGIADVVLLYSLLHRKFFVKVPVFNVQPQSPHETAELAFYVLGNNFHLGTSVRTDGDYGLTVESVGITQNTFATLEAKITTWGVPGDPSHESEWISQVNEPIDPAEAPPQVAFFTNPTRCDAPLGFSAEADSYEEYGVFGPALTATTPQLTGCATLPFAPTLKARPTTNATDSPSGLDVDLTLPQNDDPKGQATAELKDVQMTLPEGLVVNPSSANGLEACTPQQIGLTTPVGSGHASFSLGKPNCPAASRLGSVEVDTPVFDDPLKGSVFLASPHQNPFGSLLALYLTIEGHGLAIRLAGKLSADPKTGRLTATFDENPQTPFEHLRVKFNSGAFAPLRTPASCGTYATTSQMISWGAPEAPTAAPKDEYAITQGAGGKGCAAPANTPSFDAGSVSPIAGAYKPFVVNLKREDGTQQFAAVTVTPPPGLVAKLKGTATCSDAALASAASKTGNAEKSSPSCPASSEVGSVFAAAGAGPAPYNAPGKVYLAGPYKGAPLSLATVIPATAGPFDLGTVVTRVALAIDPTTAQVTATSDPLPTILQGIPLDVRSVSLRLDKPDFSLNPTSCDPMAVKGTLLSTTGAGAALDNRFQLAECGRLKFKPSLAFSLKGKTTRSGHPALTAVLKPRAGDANIASVSVALPHSEFLAQNHIRTVCTRVQFAADQCPKGSIYGKVSVTTPILDQPLTGPVYLRSSSNPLPDLVVDLHGPPSQPIRFEASGRIDSVNGGIRNTFDIVPDVPFTKLTLQLQGAKKGLLENSRNICASTNRAAVTYTAHNGAAYSIAPELKAKGCGAKGRKGKGSRHR